MNTIRRSRKRPRVRSVNFRTFYWLVRRVAGWHVIMHGRRPIDCSPELVTWFLALPSYRVQRMAESYLGAAHVRLRALELGIPFRTVRGWLP